jgi:hypothetical protein
MFEYLLDYRVSAIPVRVRRLCCVQQSQSTPHTPASLYVRRYMYGSAAPPSPYICPITGNHINIKML